MKFGRRYQLTIDMNDGSGQIVITLPFTIQFTIDRSAGASLNSLNLVIYNLGAETRNRIRQDRFYSGVRTQVKLEGGYDQLSTMFVGNILQAYSARRGSDIVTIINAQDGGFDTINTISSKTIAPGTSLKDVLKALVGDFPNLNQGAIGEFDGRFNRGVVLDDNTLELLKKYSAFQLFIDKEKVFVLQNNEVISGDLAVINASTGLLETPIKEQAYINVATLFEPRVTVGQLIELASTVEPIYNGQYKVLGVNHQGIISEAVNGQCISRFNLLAGGEVFGSFKTVGTNETTSTS